MEKSQPIVIIAENTTSVASGIVELFNVQNMADGDYSHTGETEIREEAFRNRELENVQQVNIFFYNQQYIIVNIPQEREVFKQGNNLTIEVGLFGGVIETITDNVGKYDITSFNVFSGEGYGIGNPYLVNHDLTDNGLNFFCFVKDDVNGLYLIYRDGMYPSDTTTPQYFVIVGNKSEKIVTLSSGIPNVDLKKIYADVFGGAVYVLSKVRIECISTNGDKNDVVCQPITYGIRTSEGNSFENPIYPALSVMQKIECADVELNGLLLNSDTILNIASIPPHTKVRYMFYASEKSNPTITAFKADLDKELIVPDLNKIDGVSQEKVLEIQSPKTDAKNPNVPEKDKKCSWLWLIAVGFGIFATYKLIKD